ncbi:hypothetical protein DLP3_146 [Stenotrophomonas phage vB_SmaS_DLP_3]|nr:hypothetical protein DLP3_146 [Stenotrophomonas phage vB_SmaS_DLP_3]
MAKYRIVRGQMNEHTGKMMGFGVNYSADSVKEALAKELAETNKLFRDPGPLGIHIGAKPLPVVKVWELVEVPESEWAK